MKRFYFIFFTLFLPTISFCQTSSPGDYVSWSANRKLTIKDFVIKTNDLQTNSSFAQFSINYQVNGFDFMTKNFNKKVHNYVITSASWIDTTFNVKQSINYQQTLFDISEIYTRRFRKELKANRKKIISGTSFVEELNARIMNDFAKRRIEYDIETKFGSDFNNEKKWEMEIQKELEELKEFSIE